MSVATVEGEQRTVLQNISWCTYISLMNDTRDSSVPRIAFADGTLEITVPSARHEKICFALNAITQLVAMEFDYDHANFGSTTHRRDDLERGFEPDLSFYVAEVERMRGKDEIDLSVDPAPDLIVEIDITSPSLNKLPLFARLGIRELWWHRNGILRILILSGDDYQETEQSIAFPVLTAKVLNDFLRQEEAMHRPEWLRLVRDWARREGNYASGNR